MRLWFCLLLLLGACQPVERVTITLQNDTTEALRCLLVFAHWVTLELPPLLPGAATEVRLRRQPTDGALFQLHHDGRRLMLETVTCGKADAWQPEVVIGLLPLQVDKVHQVTLLCQRGARLQCRFLK